MRYWLNVGHVQFNILLAGQAEVVIGKLVHCDETGLTILVERDGTLHSYAAGVVQHACLAP